MGKQFNAHLGEKLNREFEVLAQRTGHNKSSLLELMIRQGTEQLKGFKKRGAAPIEVRVVLSIKEPPLSRSEEYEQASTRG